MSELQEKQLIKTIVCPAKVSDFNPKMGESTLDYKGSIASAKGAVTKLSKNLNGYAPFYIVENYFKDPATKKPIGSVLVMGKEKKVQKHFVTVEMKSGKVDQRSSSNQKEAATGRVYAKRTEAGLVLCFEPHPKCKVPAPKWPKLFKALKPCLKGMSCEVVPPSAAALAEAAAEEAEETGAATAAGTQQTAGTQQAAGAGYDPAELKSLLSTSANGMTVVKGAIDKIKAGNGSLTQQDLTAVQQLLGNISQLKTVYQAAPAQYQNAAPISGPYTKIVGQEPSIQKLVGVIQARLGGNANAGQGATGGISPEIQALLDSADKLVNYAKSNHGRFKTEMEQRQAPPIAGGDAFLSSMQGF